VAGIGGTVADILSVMEILDNELENGAGEIDEGVSIIALVQAQHWFETVASSLPKVLQSIITVTTTGATETSTFSTSLRRLDAMWGLDANGNPTYKLDKIEGVGDHVPSLPWPLDLFNASLVGGVPYGYYASATQFYWLPVPDAAYTARIYGFVKQQEFALRTDNFNYPPECKLPFAQFASKLLGVGKNDDTAALDQVAAQLFRPLLRSMRKFDRSKPTSRYYNSFHTT